MIDSSQSTSTRPYLLRALYEWCADNALTPYVAAYVDDSVRVPREYVKNNEIVLNISMDATSNLQIGNDFLRFKARFGGQAREIVVPIDHIIAIYARENGQGMAFPVPQAVPPRGEVQEAAPAERPSKGLRPVDTRSGDAAATPPRAQATPNPLLQSSIEVAQTAVKEPVKLVKLKAAPTPSKESLADDDTQPTPPPSGAPAGAGKNTPRPALTRIK
jgi:stringent starvation protein B